MTAADCLSIVNFALTHDPSRVNLIPFANIVTSARLKDFKDSQNGVRLSRKIGVIAAQVPVAIARNLRQPADERDFMLLIHIPREVAEAATTDDLIIKPGLILP